MATSDVTKTLQPGGASSCSKTISIFVPALNEEENLAPTVTRLVQALGPSTGDYEIIVVNDGSSDRTAEVADSLASLFHRVKVLHNPQRMGLGYSYIKASEAASKNFFVYIPGDNTWPLQSLETLFQNLGKADIITSYVANPRVRNAARRWISSSYTTAVNLLFGYNLKYYNGLTIYPSSFLKLRPISTFGFGFQAEVLLRALFIDLSYIEVCLVLDKRSSGGSKAVNTKNILSVVKTITLLFWKLRILKSWPGIQAQDQVVSGQKLERTTSN